MPRLLLVLSMLAAASAWAQEQEPDTTAAWLYYPLEVGNLWEYQHFGLDAPARFERRAVERDTLLGAHRYFEQATYLSNNGADWALVERAHLRFDTTAGRVLARQPGGAERPRYCELGYYGLSACEPDVLPMGVTDATVFFVGTTVYARHYPVEVRAAKGFLAACGPCEVEYYPVFAAPLGYVGAEPYFCTYCGTSLLYVRAGDREHGLPIVEAEGGAPRAGALAIAAVPNPADGPLHVTVTLAAVASVRVEAFDGLGRRVALLHDGPLAAGPTALRAVALRPGMYIVRATSGVQHTATRVAVQ